MGNANQKRKPADVKSLSSGFSSSEEELLQDLPPVSDAIVDYDIALEEARVGGFHVKILILCGIAFGSTALVPTVIRTSIPPLQCELSLSESGKNAVNGVTYIGTILGCLVAGVLADFCGRRPVLQIALLVNSVMTFITSQAWEVVLLAICRLIGSFSSSGVICLSVVMFAEFSPPAIRGMLVSCLQTFVALASVLPVVLPISPSVALILACIPPLLVAVALSFVPESHRYLLTQERNKDAVESLQQVFAGNSCCSPDEYPVRYMRDNEMARELSLRPWDIPTPPYLIPRWYWLPIVALAHFWLLYSYYTLALWFPDLTTRHEMLVPILRPSDADSPSCDLGRSWTLLVDHCDKPPLTHGPYTGMLLTSLAALPATIWLILAMDTLGRLFFLTGSHVVAGFLTFLSYFLQGSPQSIVFTTFFQAMASLSLASTHCLVVELVATRHRATMLGVVLALGQFGAMLGHLGLMMRLGAGCLLMDTVMAVTLLLSGMLALALPDTVGMTLR